MVVQTCILALEKWEHKDHKFSHPLLPRELQASLSYLGPCVKKQKQKQKIETEQSELVSVQHSGSRSRGISVSSEAAWSTTVNSKPAKAT